MSTSDTLSALKAAIAAAGANNEALAKVYTFSQPGSATVGLQDYDLSPAVLNLYPVLTPLRNIIPRVSGGFGTQANWKAVTQIDTSMVFGGVSEGHRGSVIGVSTKEYFAAYRTLGTESAVTDEATLAAADFDDVRARAANSGLQALMLIEEGVILGGNTSSPLGVTPTPALTAATTGGAIAASTTVSVIAVALTTDGRKRSSVQNGVVGTVSRTTADGFVENVGGGSARKSAAASVVTNSGSSANSVTAKVTPVPGAYGYAWYAGAPGSEMLFAITSISMVVLTAMPASGQLASALPAVDSSCDGLVHDGLLTMAGNPSNGANWTAVPAGQGLTPDGIGGIVEFDQILQAYWDNLRLSPGSIWVSSQEALWIRRKIQANVGPGSISRFTFQATPGAITGGGALKGYLNSFSMGNGPAEIPISIHPNMPPGTVLFLTHELPYQMNNVDNILQIKTRKEYYQTEWPRRTRAYEYGVYSDQVLQNKFMPGMAVLTNLSPL